MTRCGSVNGRRGGNPPRAPACPFKGPANGRKLCRAGLHLGATTVGRILKEPSQPTLQTPAVANGRVFTGLLVTKDQDEVVLKDAQAKDLRFAADEIELLVPQQKSLMPDLLWQDMTAQELADLLAFLVSLRS